MTRLFFAGSLLVMICALSALGVGAQNVVLSNNSGDGNSTWFITGEASLVMNGFDLTAHSLTPPVAVEKVSISVVSPTPGTPVDILIYQDANGGSPIDATLAGRSQADITQAGVFTFEFDTPIVVTQPVVWVGFYLPVDFRFRADVSGTSVLTYWAWTPNARFDLASLSSAAVLGPADGTAPVNINMQGIARITAEVRGATEAEALQTPGIVQVSGSSAVSLLPLVEYAECDSLFIDTDDVTITLKERVKFHCKWFPPVLAPQSPAGYEQRGNISDVFVFGDTPTSTKLPALVTHCVRPPAEDINAAVIGLAEGQPRQWRILPSQRYGDLVCAELADVGLVSYFVPVTSPAPTPAAAP